ncbi:heterokaryon incompatibility protein-domain-containing protein [Pisolithus thermaeus]|nr:heterokaryon incompatibility protein-domain-containing protein [Pisolithus thermaeus]
MRLIHVRTFLDLEEGKKVDPEEIVLKELDDEELAKIKYGILSHCWGNRKEEVQYKEMDALIRMGGPSRKKLRQRSGYHKILRSCEQAWKDGLAWLWVDTCCINKESSAELSEALNSMFRWYEDSERCYVFLHDLDAKILPTISNSEMFPDSSGWPRWFSRGWTLQELVAPSVVHFFNKDWRFIGDKKHRAQTISSITRVPSRVLIHGLDAHRHSAAQIMSWAADRKTTRTEDRAYSLMGLFGVHMPMLYGEGKNAFRRLQLEITRVTSDHSIFAWDRKDNGWSGSVLADDPSYFQDCHDIVNMEPDEYLAALKGVVPDNELSAANEESVLSFRGPVSLLSLLRFVPDIYPSGILQIHLLPIFWPGPNYSWGHSNVSASVSCIPRRKAEERLHFQNRRQGTCMRRVYSPLCVPEARSPEL